MSDDLTITSVLDSLKLYLQDMENVDDLKDELLADLPCIEDMVVKKDLFDRISPEAREIIDLLIEADPDIVGHAMTTYKQVAYNKRKLNEWIRQRYPGKGSKLIRELTRLARAC